MTKAELDGLPAEVSADLATALVESRWADALALTTALIDRTPDEARLWFVHGVLLRQAWRMDEAMAAYHRSIELGYAGPGPYRELFQHLEKRGQIDEALELWRRADEGGCSTAPFHSRALDALLKHPDADGRALRRAHQRWAELYARPDAGVPALDSEPFDESRPLRVGFICSFWEAATIRFMLLPVLARVDRHRVHAYLYLSGPLQNGESWRERFAPHVEAIRDVHRADDRTFIAAVRADAIDILIDLNGHSGAQRYAAMANRCAPVQAVYLNYTSTTAVPNIDCVIGDAWSPPPGTERDFTERVVRIDGCFFCFDYRDDPLLPAVAPVPSARSGEVTFGCFGASTKINGTLIGWWCQLLAELPEARLFIRNFELSPADNRRALLQQFAARGIGPERLRLMGKGTRHELLRSYADVDIALDTYPYAGGNTTAEALWQGVPVITLRGDRFSSSYGASLLHGAGVPELIASSPDDYVARAAALARSPQRLAHYRARLRSMVVEHGLGNADMFTPRFEQALRAMRAGHAAAAPVRHGGREGRHA